MVTIAMGEHMLKYDLIPIDILGVFLVNIIKVV